MLLAAGARRWSSSASNPARVAAARSYLEAWVGGNTSPTTVNTPENVRTSSCPLLVSGTSYLLATLRLEKTDTPYSLAERLQDYAQDMPTSNASGRQWKCPIVLDLRAWCPDGSPHYRPPKTGTLKQVVSLLDLHGLTVVGINETPKELEAEAFQDMGLPALYSSSNRTPNRKFELEDVLQMVIRQQQEQPITEIPEEESFAAEATTDIPAASKIVEKESEVACPTIEVLKGSTTENASKSTDVGMPQLPPMPPSATVYQGTVRSGQQVSSEKGCSLLILGSVSSGGEVLSDGDIMVLGKLRGRALAGLSAGSARIIATSMDPELISVGGVLSTGDRVNGIVAGAAAMVSLNDQKELVFQKISIT